MVDIGWRNEIRGWLEDVLVPTEKTPHVYADHTIGDPLPQYRTGVGEVDDATRGGLRGFTAVVGTPKSGKSYFVGGIGAKAVEDGWVVVICDFELGPDTVVLRLRARCGLNDKELPPQWLLKRWNYLDYTVAGSPPVERICRDIQGLIPAHASRLLIIFDSVSRYADGFGNEYFGALGGVLSYLARLTLVSHGRISAVAVYETNQVGSDKGRKAGFLSDCTIHMQAVKPVDKSDGVRAALTRKRVEFSIVANRWGPDCGLSTHVLDHVEGKFDAMAEDVGK